jgi:hypothetical protein
MMFTDEHRRTVWDQIRQQDLRAFSKWLSPERLKKAATIAGVGVGRGPLSVVNLTWLAVASALHDTKSFADVLTLVLKFLADAEGFASTPLGKERSRAKRRKPTGRRSKHDPRCEDPTKISVVAFTKARRLLSLEYWRAVFSVLSEVFEATHGDSLYWNGFRLLATDGTIIPLRGWKRLRKHFGTANNGKGKKTVQARMVMLQFPLVRIPYRYELSPLSVAEKTLASQLLQDLKPKDLVLLDRGFWSFGLFYQIQDQAAFFGIRLFKSAKLKTLRRLGPKDRLVRYAPIDRKWRLQGLPESITLRVIDYQIKGFRPSAVVTNVLDPQVTTPEDWVRLAVESDPGRRLDAGLYHRRWEIETTFFELKVSQGMKSHLRSRTAEGIAYEVAGHVLFYFLVRWMMVEAAKAHGKDPLRLSFTQALRELQDMSQTLVTASPQRVSRVLLPRLLARIAAHVVPKRPGRHYARPHDTKVKNKGKGHKRLPAKLSTHAPRRQNKRKRAA